MWQLECIKSAQTFIASIRYDALSLCGLKMKIRSLYIRHKFSENALTRMPVLIIIPKPHKCQKRANIKVKENIKDKNYEVIFQVCSFIHTLYCHVLLAIVQEKRECGRGIKVVS